MSPTGFAAMPGALAVQRRGGAALAAALFALCPQVTSAQQQPATPVPAPAPQQFQQSAEWSKLPRMQLERQFAGPLQDTVIQRWRDPVDGTVCYIYLPISVAHTPTSSTGFVQYGSNTIGSINCLPNPPAAPAPNGRK
jgi:hypothetical protein